MGDPQRGFSSETEGEAKLEQIAKEYGALLAEYGFTAAGKNTGAFEGDLYLSPDGKTEFLVRTGSQDTGALYCMNRPKGAEEFQELSPGWGAADTTELRQGYFEKMWKKKESHEKEA